MKGVESLDSARMQAKVHSDSGQYGRVVDCISAVRRDHLLEDPQLCLLLVNALRRLHRSEEASALLVAMEPSIRSIGDLNAIRRWQNGYASYLGRRGRIAEARTLLTECLYSAEMADDARTIVMACNTMGLMAITLGETEEAISYWKREIAAAQVIGDLVSVAYGHHNLGVVHREGQQLTEAATHLLLAQEYISERGTEEERLMMACERALLLASLNDYRQAEAVVNRVVSRAIMLANEELRQIAMRAHGSILLMETRLDEARANLEATVLYWRSKPHLLIEQEINVELAMIAALQHRDKDLEDYKGRIMAFCNAVGATRRLAHALAAIESAHDTARETST
jgi:tetratricopeptide (TPR) repeat protein